MKRRENPRFLEFIARVDVGCSAVEMAANWFPCDRQLRTIQEIPYKWTYFLNKRFESSDWVLNMSMSVYTDLISCLNSCIDLQVSRRVRKRKETVCGLQSRLCYWTVSMQFFKIIQVQAHRIQSFRCCLALDVEFLKGCFCYLLRYLICRPELLLIHPIKRPWDQLTSWLLLIFEPFLFQVKLSQNKLVIFLRAQKLKSIKQNKEGLWKPGQGIGKEHHC